LREGVAGGAICRLRLRRRPQRHREHCRPAPRKNARPAEGRPPCSRARRV